MVCWSCELFSVIPEVSELILVVPPEVAERPPQWSEAYGATLVAGGRTRTESVSRGIAAIGSSVTVLIHDAARPFVSSEQVARVLAAAGEQVSVIPVLQIADAVKSIGPGDPLTISGTLDRSELRAAQTPQAFPVGLIRDLHAKADAAGLSTPDDAALVESAGLPVVGVPGERWAFKITEPEDLDVAEWLVATGRVHFGGGSR
jgi:2-C-methyl-D-erythritol 4-phosphate cytidylyltransferase/2-C-methyl-D-erythritol 2,4-cyclodiphosphate synthase